MNTNPIIFELLATRNRMQIIADNTSDQMTKKLALDYYNSFDIAIQQVQTMLISQKSKN